MSHISSGAIVKIERDASITLLNGAADIGQGAEIVISQIVAEELGVPLEDIRITAADTEITPLDPGTFGSGVTLRAVNAAQFAAQAAKEKLFEAVAEKMEVSIEELEAKNRRINVKGSPERGISLEEAIKFYQYSDFVPCPSSAEVLIILQPKSQPPFLKKMEIFLCRAKQSLGRLRELVLTIIIIFEC